MAKYLFNNWDIIDGRLKGKSLFLFLDYDGTLANIARLPRNAKMHDRMRQLLEEIIALKDCKVSIVSGRAIDDLRRTVGLKGVLYIGNHGFEIHDPKVKFKSPLSSDYLKILDNIKRELKEKLARFKEVFIEDKGISLCVHYRLAGRQSIPEIKTIFHETAIIYAVKEKVKIGYGKKVLEIRPFANWDKGKVVLWLLARSAFTSEKNVLPIYIGDDLTDEDAFCVLKQKGLTVAVGKSKGTSAEFYLKNTSEVFDLLERIKDARTDKS